MPDVKSRLASIERRLSVRFEYFTEITSTNDLAVSANCGHGDVIWAESQTKGRGQRGNSWSSEAGENLTFSLVLNPDGFPAESQFYLSKIVSLGLTEALEAFGFSASIKWPNDIYIGNKKVAGILIENDLQGSGITRSIAGIGLNVNQKAFDPLLPNPVSMLQLSGCPHDRTEVLEKVLERIFCWYDCLREKNFNAVDTAYMKYLYRKSGKYLFQEPGGEPFEASVSDVMPSGELILERNDGTRKSYLFKEVEFIIKEGE